MDWGKRNPTAVIFGAINPKNGELVIYHEYYQPNMLLPDHAKNLKPLISEIPYGMLRFMVCDPSCGNKLDVVKGKSVQGLFQEYGLFFSLGNNSIESGILKVNSFIERGKMKVFHTCVNLIKEAYAYKYEELDIDSVNENFDEKPIKAQDHAMDALRYLCMRLPDNIDLLKSDSFNPPTRYVKPTEQSYAENEFGWTEDGKHEFTATYW